MYTKSYVLQNSNYLQKAIILKTSLVKIQKS